MEQPRVERVLRLMRLMSGNVRYTVEQLAEILETSYRSIYRYIDTFKTVGFAVEKDENNVYRLMQLPTEYEDLKNLVYFSEEEAQIVCNLIEGLDSSNTLKANLYKKLIRVYDVTKTNEFEGVKSNSANVQALKAAMDEHRKVVLKSYASANSGIIRDRLVEPFGFTNNHIDVWAFDIEKRANRLFKIPRIDWVDVLSEEWSFATEHHKTPIDAFHMSGDSKIHVRLEMSLLAKNLLQEEFPLAIPDIYQEDDEWIFDSYVCRMEGIGRFVLGLRKDIKIIDSPELSNYVKEYIESCK